MSEHRQLSDKDITIKSYLTQARKIGGRIVREEVEIPRLSDEEGIDTLLDGVDSFDIAEGRERLLRENPQAASELLDNMIGEELAEGELMSHLMDPRRIAASKRVGKIRDLETNEIADFRREGSNVRITTATNEIITVTSAQFDNMLGTGSFGVM